MNGPRRAAARPVIIRTLPRAQAGMWPAKPLPDQNSANGALLPKSFIALQVQFAWVIAAAHGIPFQTALLDCTTVHRRLFRHPDKGVDPRWWDFANSLPEDPDTATDLIYDAYVLRETRPRRLPVQEVSEHGCFSFEYRAHKNQFVLHFSARDPRGNLCRTRMEARRQDLMNLSARIARYRKWGATVRMSSWLLDIDAFNRLMPEAFCASAKVIAAEKTQDMGLWGQFLSPRDGIKPALGQHLLDHARNPSSSVSNSFPHREWTTTVPQEVFFETYLGSQGRVSQLQVA